MLGGKLLWSRAEEHVTDGDEEFQVTKITEFDRSRAWPNKSTWIMPRYYSRRKQPVKWGPTFGWWAGFYGEQ